MSSFARSELVLMDRTILIYVNIVYILWEDYTMPYCKYIEEELKRVSMEREGTNYLFKAYLVSLILGFISIPFLIAATLSSATSEPSSAIATLLIGAGIIDIIIAVIVVPIMYKGFRLLAMASQDYGIGVTGTIIQGIGSVLSGIVLVGAGNHLANISRGASPENVMSAVLHFLGYLVLAALIGLLGGIMVLIALWRLGDTYPQYGGDVLKIGLVIWIIGYALQVFQVRGGGLLALVGILVLLYGLHRLREELGSLQGEKEYELERCRREEAQNISG